MARRPDDLIEENSEQVDDGQAQDVGDDAVARLREAGPEDRDPIVDSEHGGHANPGAVIPDDVPDLIDTMNQMLTSGLIDNGAFAGEPMMDDEEDQLGETDRDDDDGL
jgi:hypothetical protein